MSEDRFQVKFPCSGEIRYGIVDQYTDTAKKYAAKGILIIEDAILPLRYKIKDDGNVVDIPMSMTREGGEYERFMEREFAAAKKIASGLPEGMRVGKMFSIAVADGVAWYIVTRVSKSTCDIEWRGFENKDRYIDIHFSWGGNFRVKDVAYFVEMGEAEASFS